MSEFKFTKKVRPSTDFESFYGRPKDKMSELIAAGFGFGNYRDLAKARNPKYNADENDRSILHDNYFTLPGNPVLSNPNGNGEQIIIVNLEHKDLAEVKALVAGLNKNTILNNNNALDMSQEMYDAIGNIPGATHRLKPSLVNDLKNNGYNNKKARQALIEAFFQGNTEEAKEYIALVQDYHKVKNIDTKMGYFPGNFTGMRLVWAGSVGDFADAYCYYSLYINGGRLFGVGAGGATAPTTQVKIVAPSLQEILAIEKNNDISSNQKIKEIETLYSRYQR
ncbi:MAG: hypothetical protein ACP5N3_00385 [Candidatus Nanoarchaeia archaeon]